jgi:large subunit ribosomal protein L6
MKFKELSEKIEIPEGVTVTYVNGIMAVKGKQGEVTKKLLNKKVNINIDGSNIEIKCKFASKREKAVLFTYKAHINNMFKGVIEGYVYKLKICSGHFPMNVTLKGDVLSVKNFLGEKIPRLVKIKPDAKVSIDGNEIEVKSIDKEKAGQVAADIEQVCRVVNRDRRIFQDGIYITSKAGKEIV